MSPTSVRFRARRVLLAGILLALSFQGFSPLAQEDPAGGTAQETPAAAADKNDEAATAAPAGPQVILEIRGLHYDVGTPVQVRVSARNDTDKTVDNPLADPLASGLALTTADGKELKPTRAGDRASALRPQKLAPGAYFGQIVDIAPLFPVLAETGKYTLAYRSPAAEGGEVTINILPVYHPDATYTATIKTSLGDLELEFYPDSAPLAVRNFVDLSRQGFYDGLTFHYVRQGDIIMGGDPHGDGSGGSGFGIPAEFSDRKHVAGSIGMVRGMERDSASSQFYICLAPQPERDGIFTLFAQIVNGMDVLEKIGAVPTTGRQDRPHFRPLEPVVIESVTIHEKAAEETAP